MLNNINITASVGRWALHLWDGLCDFGRYIYSILESFKSFKKVRFRAVNAIIINQVRYTGIDALPFVVLIALFVGGLVIIQATTNMPKFGVEDYLGNVLVIIIARELGPLVTALIVISRSGSAMASEVATQKWSREILSLEIIGVDPRLYIVFPRIIAAIFSIFSLIIFFDIVAFFGGYLLSRTIVYIPMDAFFKKLALAFSVNDLLATVVKSLIFGILIPLVSCYYGLMPESKFQIPIYVSRAVSRTLFATIMLNALISIFFYF